MTPVSKKLTDYAFLLSLLVVMTVWLPVNYLGFINFDDVDLINRIHECFGRVALYTLFFQASPSEYYRPLLEILCYLDYAMWGLSTSAWHLTNYILHILNACMVFLIARHWFDQVKNNKIWATVAMLFFALNPMTCESVAWISGRSDLAGTFFSLVAVWLYHSKTDIRYILSPLAILAGLLCKENALAVIPLIVCLEAIDNYKKKQNMRDSIKGCLTWGLIVSIPLFIYWFLRTNGFEYYFIEYDKTVAPMVSNVTSVNDNGLAHNFVYLFPVIAFYLKKLIIPFPLNFAIMKINTLLYSFIFLIVSGINVFCLFKKRWALPVFSLLLIISFSPALIIAMERIAWSPMAERYLYLSLCVMGIGLSLFLNYLYKQKYLSRKSLIIICLLLITVFTISSFNRIFLFNDSKAIWTATLKVNPNDSMVLCKYGQAVGGKQGQVAFQRAVLNPEPFKWRAKAFLVLGKYEIDSGNCSEGIKLISNALEIEDNYQNRYNAASILSNAKDLNMDTNQRCFAAAVHHYKKAYAKRKTVFVLYQTALLLKRLDEIEEAKYLFKTLIQDYPKSKYAGYSKKQLEKHDPPK